MDNQELSKAVIKKLPQNVIDQIAAGEVIQKPYSVIKELVENSIDAESKQIDIKLKNGGLDEILIQDNGKGISPDDFPLLCERFATSKLQNFQGLSSLQSFGFRGEALASISYVSDLTITSQTKNSDLGYTSIFKDSKMLDNPQAISAKQGTIIKATDLFSTLLPRRKSVNPKEEYRNVLKFIMSMSVHHQKVKFILKFDRSVEFQTPQPHSRKVILSKMSFIPVNQFTEADLDIYEEYKCKIEGVFSNLSATKKMKEVILFINDRYVFNDSIRKSVEKGYLQCYEGIHTEEGGYYVYLNLQIKHQNVDPNVNPTKKEVKFLFENQIAQQITEFIVNTLKNTCHIKSISQITKPQAISFSNGNVQQQYPQQKGQQQTISFFSQQQSQNQPQYQKKLIRNDPKLQKIDQFFKRKSNDNFNYNSQQSQNSQNYSQQSLSYSQSQNQNFSQSQSQNQNQINDLKQNQKNSNEEIFLEENSKMENDEQMDLENKQNSNKNIVRQNSEGSSILRQTLWQILKQQGDSDTQEFFQNLTYVGCLSQNYILAQFQTSLYLVNTLDFSYEKQNTDNKNMNNNNENDNNNNNVQQHLNSYYNQDMQLKYNEFFETEFIPLLKNQTVFRQIDLKRNVTPVLQLEHIYKYFERC